MRITLIEDDAHAAERAGFFLSRAAAQRLLPSISTDLTDVAGADAVIEALDAPPEQRMTRMAQVLDQVAPGTALLTLTGCGVAAEQGSTALQQRLVHLHLFAPVHLRSLVEIAPCSLAAEEALPAAFDLVTLMGKTPVRAPLDRPSIGVRLERRMIRTCEDLLMQGAIPHEVDEAMVAFGFDLGPFQAQDLIGLDRAYADRKASGAPVSLIFDRMVEEGRLGQKVGVGFYRYPGGGGAVIDPLVEDLIREEARFAGVEPREFTADEVQTRLILAMAQEVADMLADGTAAKVADINTVARLGFGFPADMGGPADWADAHRPGWRG
ncbi:3-hydroxyacyl-CoA dehydrogenase family protein [Arenibacterium sp. CAU 1754]